MTDAPTNISVDRSAREIDVEWPDGRLDTLPCRYLRGHCPCAVCVNEFTGVRVVGTEEVAANVVPAQLELTGNYALKIYWSDGHNTGLYSWDRLRELGEQLEAERETS